MTQPPAPEHLATPARPAPPETRPRPAGDTRPTSKTSPASDAQPQREAQPTEEIGVGILGTDPLPPIADEVRRRRSEGLLEVTAEYQAEHGAFTEEERARARAKLTSLG